VASPIHGAREWILHVTNLSNLTQEVEKLRTDNQKLKEWYDRAQQLDVENRALQKFLRLSALPRTWFVSARVVGEVSQPNSRYVIIDVGSSDGVTQNDAVLTADGLVGRVQNVASNSAHVLLLTDASSRVPVVVEESRYRGVVAGNNSTRPDLRFLPDSAQVAIGSRLVTSGFGGIFLPGIPVGLVSTAHDNQIEVKPYVDWQRLDYVQVMRFDTADMPQLTDEMNENFQNTESH
jgi:rod shape-determining protein MreC